MFQARVFSLPNSRISHFSKELWLLSLENGTQKLRSVSGVCSFLTGVSLLTVKAREKNHVCPNPSINTHLYLFLYFVVVVQSLSRVRFFATPWTAACQASLSFTISQTLLKLMSIESVMPSNHLILCCPFLLLPSIFPSIRGCSNEWALQSVLPVNIQDWFPLGFAGLISLLSKGLSRVFSNTTDQKHQFFGAWLSSRSRSYIHT